MGSAMADANAPRTFATVLAANKGAGPGFDAIRVGLSLVILLSHTIHICYGNSVANAFYESSPLYPVLLALVPMFFGLSGFLVTGSAFRTRSVKVFLTFRLLRIYPALTVEIFLTALLLGPLLTRLPLFEYFSHPTFFEYFGSLIGRVKFILPGLFESNPWPYTVNQNLWTLKAEFYCYLLMTLLMLSKLVFDRKWFSIAFLAATVVLSALNFALGFGDYTRLFPPHMLLYYFVLGIFAFHWKHVVPVSFPLFVVSLIAAYVLVPLHGWAYVAAFPLSYTLLYVGMLKIPRIPLLQRGDYSYGIYLFGFPIQQMLVSFFPVLREWWLLFPVSAVIAVGFAALSWHFVEKPALRLKRRLLPQASVKAAPASRSPIELDARELRPEISPSR
jgi:peptidoglycan/LPS O-acetylase OafA/YrhL